MDDLEAVLRRYLGEGGCGTRAQAIAEKELFVAFVIFNTPSDAALRAADLIAQRAVRRAG